MTCILSVISQVKTVAVCGFVMLIFHTGVMSGAEVQPQKPGSNVIRVWSIGSPLTGALPQNTVPPALELQAKKLDYTIEVVNMRAIEFAPKLRQAVHKHNEPEILTFDNFFVLEGITTPAGRIEGVLSDQHIASSLVMVYETLVPLQPRGWVILVRSAPNYQAAQTLAMQPPVCPQEFTRARQSLTLAELRRAQETATNAARSYLTCDLSSLSEVSDRSRFGKECFLPDADREVESLEACAVTATVISRLYR